jgi:site-specific DNA-methyltransferase (adenine-specific)
MPESVTDRCTKSHEYIFLLSKSKKYFFDHQAIQTDTKGSAHDRRARVGRKTFPTPLINGIRKAGYYPKANKRSVWTVCTRPFKGAHFATFPPSLIEDCIKAGCPENGIVLDPFFGAGTTGLVARQLNRNFIGFELNPGYIKIAEERLRLAIEKAAD